MNISAAENKRDIPKRPKGCYTDSYLLMSALQLELVF